MKKVFGAITVTIVCLSCTSCGGGSEKNDLTPVEKNDTSVSETDSASEQKRLEEELEAKQRQLDSLNRERQKKEALVGDDKVKRPLHDKHFYNELLEAFCCEHFNKGFSHERFGRKVNDIKYIQHSLRVVTVANRNENTDVIKGVISYKFSYIRSCKDGGFTALITDNGEGEPFIVTFTREGADEKGHIKTIMDQPFVYDDEDW